MKKIVLLGAVGLLLLTQAAVAQLKSKIESPPPVSESLMRSDYGDMWFGFFDPSRFSMHHGYSLSYSTFGGQALSLGMYTNSLQYRFSEDLDLQTDVSLMHSPYSSFGNSKDFSGLFITRAELNYRPWSNTLINIQYRQLPPTMWYGSGYRNPFFYGIDRYEDQR